MSAGDGRPMTGVEAAAFEAFERHVRDRAIRELRPDPVAADRVRLAVADAYRVAVAGAPATPDRAGAAVANTGLTDARTSVARSSRVGPIAGWRPTPRAVPGRASTARRGVLIAACAAALAIGTVAGPAWVFASESVPGHALYGVRIAAETIGLQAVGTPERAAREARRLETRVAELREEIRRGDWGGAAAALEAARAQTAEVESAVAAAPGARRTVRQALTGARQDLESLERDRGLPADIRAGGRSLEREMDRGLLGRDRS